MPGQFSKFSRPKRPGAYVDFVALPQDVVLPSTGKIVALPFTSDWGPFKKSVLLTSFQEFLNFYGFTKTSPGYKAMKGCFKGEGLTGRGGAGAVIAYRFGGSSAAKATKTLVNTAGSPANCITLTAAYEGTFGNGLNATVQINATDATKKDLIILNGTVELERYTHTASDIAGFVSDINSASDWITASLLVNGTAIADVAASAFAGGDDGSTLSSGDWSAAYDALEVERFSLFAPFDMTSPSLFTALYNWASTLNTKGKRFMTVIGGALGDVISGGSDESNDAKLRTIIFRDSGDFVNLGGFDLTDVDFGDMSPSQLAPRVAGILAAKGESQSLTFGRLQGTVIKRGPTESRILLAIDGGVTTVSRDSHPDSPVRIEKGMTTYLGGNSAMPYLIYRQPKYVRTMHLFETEVTEWAELNVIGRLPINQQTRDFVVGWAKGLLDRKVRAGAILPGGTVGIDQDPPPTDQDEFIALAYNITFARALEQVFNTVVIN